MDIGTDTPQEAALRKALGLLSRKEQVLEAVAGHLERRRLIGTEQTYEAIFLTHRQFGLSTNVRLRELAKYVERITPEFVVLHEVSEAERLAVAVLLEQLMDAGEEERATLRLAFLDTKLQQRLAR